jgi:Na+-transporting NADH:ubiquinone oxidoreductase subunit C
MADDSIGKTFLTTLGVCIVCSILVSTAAVTLNKIQENNKKVDKIKNILIAGGLYDKKADVIKTFEQRIEPVIININTGETLTKENYTDELNPDNFDIKVISEHPKYGEKIPQDKDIAGIQKRPGYM